MTQPRDDTRDDAPATASKRGDAAVEALSGTIAEAQGSHILGRAVTINKPADELFAFFRDFANLPSFMENVVSIDVLDDTRSHWVVKGPIGRVEWTARVTEEQPGRLIAWTSEEGAQIPNSGRVEFKPVEGRGTVVTATILYDPPGGIVGKVIAKMFQREPGIQARRDLRRFKQLMETGEVATPAMNPKQFEEMGL
ncbi:Polyketide cyclase / dehydrase and lipid transport [Sphingomonas gellani]|uniref:Polyketide cyclase / dehydrase and lipid transport n=1 Tax=Sphingomonas gellani TaxID=1166340 RepID=A0A1H8B6F4_9SPHN|nr:SRPBCC family protein [Sphingomonas gellani]SEM78570.1 Polyketide cyclase / dehydrase and lipid transport [Sphingomonas gellani]